MQLQKNLLVVATTALAYVGLLSFNQFIFSSFNASGFSGLVFLPSGLGLVCVLLFVELVTALVGVSLTLRAPAAP